MPDSDTPRRSAERPTRAALVEAALHLFGRHGFEGTSTRRIAALAGANVSAIAYHFGGKEGLRQACVEAISDEFGAILALDGFVPAVSRAGARARLERILRDAVRFMATAGPAQDLTVFLLREVTLGGPLVEVIYSRIFRPRHRMLCQLWASATGADAESEAVRLAVFAMIGQVIYFRIGQPMILRRMGWEEIDAGRAERIADILVGNLDAALAATEGAAS